MLPHNYCIIGRKIERKGKKIERIESKRKQKRDGRNKIYSLFLWSWCMATSWTLTIPVDPFQFRILYDSVTDSYFNYSSLIL